MQRHTIPISAITLIAAIRHTVRAEFLFVTGLLVLLGNTAALASQTYPTPADGAVAGIQMNYYPTLQVSPTPYSPTDGWFRLRNDIDNGRGSTGGWVYVRMGDFSPSTPEVLDDDFTYYPIGYSHTASFEDLANEAKDGWQVDIELTVTPTHIPLGAYPVGTYEQWRPYSTTSEIIIDSYDPVSPAMSPPSGSPVSNQRSWVINVGEHPDWVDAEIHIKITVTPDAGILFSSFYAQPVEWEMSFPLRQQAYPYGELVPYFFPTAIIGQPPGDVSWSRLTQTSGTGATVGVMETQSSSRSHAQSAGIGLIGKTTPTFTETKTTEKGTYHTVTQMFAVGMQSTPAYGVGRGDQIVGMYAPGIEAYEAPADVDFRLLHSGIDVSFPYEALFNPGMNNFVDRMSADEIQGLIDLNPLSTNPHARLGGPRYIHVRTFGNLQGGLVNGSYLVDHIERAVVADKLARTTWEDQSWGFKLPYAAIIKAATGVSVPSEVIDPYFYAQATTSATMEYTNTTDLNNASGAMVEFQLGSSDPTEQLCIGIYWDTYFRTFAFRDCNTPEVDGWLQRIVGKYWLHDEPFKQWLAEVVETDAKYPWLVGFLGDGAEEEDAVVAFIGSEGQPDILAAVTRAGNVVLPEVEPGTYTVNVGPHKYALKLSEHHEITYTRVGASDEKKDEGDGK